jgi:predicted acetyltransferase
MLDYVEPHNIYAYMYFDMCKDYVTNNEDRHSFMTIEEVNDKIRRDIDFKNGNVPAGMIPSFTYWFINNENVIIGTSRLRTELNEYFKTLGGNIGYDVRPSYRKNGYGTQILKITLEIAKKKGLKTVLITCDDDNIGSYKIIEKNGGKLLNIINNDESKKLKRRYQITL